MAVLSNTALVYAKMEEALRQAMATQSNLTVPELYAKPDVHKVATKLTQVKDCMQYLRQNGCLSQFDIVDKAIAKTRGARLAYAWKEGAKFAMKTHAERRHGTKAAARAPSPVKVTKFAQPDHNSVELVLNGVEIIAGVNPATGRIRIIIDSPKV